MAGDDYRINYIEEIHYARILDTAWVNPKDYLDYDCIEDVVEQIVSEFRDCIVHGDIEIDRSEFDLEIPADFYSDWEELKQQMNDQTD